MTTGDGGRVSGGCFSISMLVHGCVSFVKTPAAASVLQTCGLFCVCDILQQTCLVRIEYRALPRIYDETENATLSLLYKVEFEFQGKVGQALGEFLLLSHLVKLSALPKEVGSMIPF